MSARISEEIQIDELIQVVETNDAQRFVGELFQRKFGTPPPDFPRHFVALACQCDGSWIPVGYIHFWPRGSAFMAGGLVIDERAYRRMPPEHRALIKSAGGMAQVLLEKAVFMLPQHDVIWAYVGDTRSRKVLLRVGFEQASPSLIMARWQTCFSEEVRREMAGEIAALDPF